MEIFVVLELRQSFLWFCFRGHNSPETQKHAKELKLHLDRRNQGLHVVAVGQFQV